MHEDNRDIVEKLAEKFYRIYGKHVVDMRPWASIGHEARGPYRALAEEAIRQMRWAHSEGLGYSAGGPMGFPGLAPEGWTP